MSMMKKALNGILTNIMEGRLKGVLSKEKIKDVSIHAHGVFIITQDKRIEITADDNSRTVNIIKLNSTQKEEVTVSK